MLRLYVENIATIESIKAIWRKATLTADQREFTRIGKAKPSTAKEKGGVFHPKPIGTDKGV